MNRNSPCFTALIELSLANKLKADLLDQGFVLSVPPYTIFAAKKKGISLALYISGKLTVQGSNKEEFISFYLEPEILKDFNRGFSNIDLTPRIGNDESGKGDFFGPLCVAGLYAGGDEIKTLLDLGVKDSKVLNDVTVMKIAAKLKERFPHKILRLYPEKYNELYEKFRNLNHLLGWCHAAVIEELVTVTGCKTVLLDQFAPKELMERKLHSKQPDINLQQRPKAEEDPVVAAASILARAAYVEGMEKLSQHFTLNLPKGASSQVIQIGRQLVARHGVEILRKAAKLHFKTRDTILNA